MLVVVLVACVLGLPIIPYAFPDREMDLFTTVFLPNFGRVHSVQDALYQVAMIVMVAYAPLATSFMLDRVWGTPAAAPWLANAIRPEVEATVAAGRRALPALLIGTLTMLPMLVQYLASGYIRSVSDGILAAVEVLIVLGRFLVLFTVVWCYVRSLIGLARMSAAPLNLLPSYLDPWLGTRALGSLALSLTFAYSVGLALGWPIVASGPAGTLMVPMVIVLFLLGFVLFFLPLRSIHRQMVEEKTSEQAWFRGRLAAVVAVSRRQPQPATPEPTTALHEAITVDIVERHIAAIRTWPIDTSIAVRLTSSIAMPLLLTLVGRQLVLTVLGV